MKYYIFRVYQGIDPDDNFELKITAKNLSQAWRFVPGEILYLSHVRAIEFITCYEV